MIQINNLTVKINGNIILNNIQYSFEKSSIHGIVGLNGTGKTTFFNSLSCIQKPHSGSISYEDKSISYEEIAYLETFNFFYSRITGHEYLNIFPQTNNDFNIKALNLMMHLPLDNLIETYSSGMKKKLALLGLIKQDKPIFLLDEPFNSLDIESIKILELVIAKLKQNKNTVFISSHIIETLTPVCDYIHLIEDGRFKKMFTKSEFNKVEVELLGNFKRSVKQIIDKSM